MDRKLRDLARRRVCRPHWSRRSDLGRKNGSARQINTGTDKRGTTYLSHKHKVALAQGSDHLMFSEFTQGRRLAQAQSYSTEQLVQLSYSQNDTCHHQRSKDEWNVTEAQEHTLAMLS